MLVSLLLLILISNAVANNLNKSVVYSKLSLISLIAISGIVYSNVYLESLNNGIALYNGLFTVNILSQSFNIFIFILTSIITVLTAFYPRKLYKYNMLFTIPGSTKSNILFSKENNINYNENMFSKENSINYSDNIHSIRDDINYSDNIHSIKDDINNSDNTYSKATDTKIRDDMNNSDNTYSKATDTKINDDDTIFLNKNSFQFTIIEYSLIMLFVLCGAAFLISVSDLVSLFLSIELQSYGLYIIATIYRNSESATGSGLTYFLLGGLSSCFILLGSAILYVNSGMTNLDNIYILNSISEYSNINSLSLWTLNSSLNIAPQAIEMSNYISFSFIILSVGLLFKISAAPFHFWSPDVYDGIPTIVTTFVATIAKISLLILMLGIVIYSDINNDSFSAFGDKNINTYDPSSYDIISLVKSNWKDILVLSSLMSLLIGSILGLTQYRIKRLFAYSTISHVGFILLALCINKMESIQAYIFYIIQYSISNLNAFFILVTIGYSLYNYKYTTGDKVHFISEDAKLNKQAGYNVNKNKEKYIDAENSPIQLLNQIKGYFYINSFLSISFAVTLFSFVGIPPLIGFFAKQMVLSAALDEGYIFMTLIAVITSVIGAAYYLNLIKLIFFSKSEYTYSNIMSPGALNNISKLNSRLGRYNDNKLILSNETNVLINDKLSTIISILTMLILLFILMPEEWFRVVNILSLSINNF